jgi:hypothetical protein
LALVHLVFLTYIPLQILRYRLLYTLMESRGSERKSDSGTNQTRKIYTFSHYDLIHNRVIMMVGIVTASNHKPEGSTQVARDSTQYTNKIDNN